VAAVTACKAAAAAARARERVGRWRRLGRGREATSREVRAWRADRFGVGGRDAAQAGVG
jgi:hypothetical protein